MANTKVPSSLVDISLPTLDSGTYTPTLSDYFNINTITAYTFFYTRVGDIVTVHGTVGVRATSSSTCQFVFTLPIATDTTDTKDLSGVAISEESTFHAGALYCDAVPNSKGVFNSSMALTTTAEKIFYLSFMYKVQ